MKKIYRERVKNRPKKYTAFTGHQVYDQYSAALPTRAKLVTNHLAGLKEIFARLFADEHFPTLLEAEGMNIPAYLSSLLQKARTRHEIY